MNKHQGFAIVAVLLIIAVVVTLVAGSLWLSSINKRINQNDAVTTQVVNVAQGGNAYWKAELVSLYNFMVNNFDLYQDDLDAYIQANPNNNISCGNYFAIGIDTNRDGTIDVGNGGTLPSVKVPVGSQEGSVSVTFKVTGSRINLTAKGTLGGSRATVSDEFSLSSINIWNNAVFTDRSAANARIQGRADIRGAIHILGEGLNATDTALDVTGNFGLGNTYEGLNSSLGVGSLGLSNPHPQDLCATLRVRRGKVLMDGSSQIGAPETANADPYLDRLKGVYTNNGFTGGVEEGQSGANIYSENGMSAKYDAGDSFDFPALNDNVPNTSPSITWAQQLRSNSLVLSGDSNDDRNILPTVNTSGQIDWHGILTLQQFTLTTGKTYLSPGCLTGGLFGINALGLTASVAPAITPSDTPLVKALELFAATNPILRNMLPLMAGLGNENGNGNGGNNGGGVLASTFTLVQNTTPDFSCVKYKVKGLLPNPSQDEVITEVTWSKTNNQLYIGGKGGVVTFLGKNLAISGGNGANDRISYKGNGVLFAESNNVNAVTGVAAANSGGDISLGIDFLPASGKAAKIDALGKRTTDSTHNNTYPATTLIGVVARNELRSETSTNQFTIAAYAQERVEVTKQTLVAGGIVTKIFDAGSQVPTVLYVPGLSEKISRFMPGAGGNGFAVTNVAWLRQ
jgi:hypothetical protein